MADRVLTDFNARVDTLLLDEAEWINSSRVDENIAAAASLYSLHRPLVKVDEFAGNGSYDYTLPDDWVQGFSRITQVEYPYDQQNPSIVPKEEWTIFLKIVNGTQTHVLRFLKTSPVASDSIRVTYTLPHSILAASSTIYANDVEAVCHLATSLCLRAIASKMLQTSEPTIAADAVNYAAKSSAASTRAKEFFQSYLVAMGLTEEVAATGMKEFDTGFVWGEEYLVHKSWHR